MKRKSLHIRIAPRLKNLLKHYVSLLRIQGKKTSEGQIIEEALEHYEIEKKCKGEVEKTRRFFER